MKKAINQIAIVLTFTSILFLSTGHALAGGDNMSVYGDQVYSFLQTGKMTNGTRPVIGHLDYSVFGDHIFTYFADNAEALQGAGTVTPRADLSVYGDTILSFLQDDQGDFNSALVRR